MDTFTWEQVIGIWTAGFLTLCVFSFLYGDNPFYKFAEHVYVGVSAGYWMVVIYWSTLYDNVFEPFLYKGDLSAVVPIILGVMLMFQLHPKTAWVARWPLAFMVGIFAGLNIVLTMQAQVLEQVHKTILPFDTVKNVIIVVGTFTGLIYFYFSVEHEGWFFGGAARIGIYVLMIALGASFGYTVMSRVSLLIGRVVFLKDEFWPATQWAWKILTGGGG